MTLIEKIAALEAENAELSEKLSKSEEARLSAQIYLDDAKERCRDEVQKLRGELSRCINKVAELEKDKERLDWVTRCLWFKCVPLVFSSRSTESRIEFNYPGEDDSNIYGKDVRSAIDAAMPEFYEEGGE